jgi:hypothetical protein
MNPADQIEQAIEKLHITTKPETDERILGDAFTAFEDSVQEQSSGLGGGYLSRTQIIRFLKPVAVAAVLILVFAVFLGTRDKKPVSFDGIYKAVCKVDNICITTFVPGTNEPVQTEWVSQTLNVNMSKISEQFVLWDIPRKTMMIKFLSSNAVKTQAISDELLDRVEKEAAQAYNLIPFSNIKKVSGAQWSYVEDPTVPTNMLGTNIFELTWTQKNTSTGVIEFRKWRVFMGADTGLPEKIEQYVKLEAETEYTLEISKVITYPSADQIQSFIHRTFGPPRSRQREPGYIGTPGG